MLVVITGGAGSGKMEYAEALIRKMCPDIKDPQFIRQYMILRNLHLAGEHVLLSCIPDLLNQKVMELDPHLKIVWLKVFLKILCISTDRQEIL